MPKGGMSTELSTFQWHYSMLSRSDPPYPVELLSRKFQKKCMSCIIIDIKLEFY